MKNYQRAIVAAIIVVLTITASYSANAITITRNTIDSGWYTSAGKHKAWNTNYFAGRYGSKMYRNFFVFDLSGITDTITSAVFTVNTEKVTGTGMFSLKDITTDISTLRTSHSNGATGQAIYADLGTGGTYGAISISNSMDNIDLDIAINTEGINAINNELGSLFAFGGRFNVTGGYTFGYSGSGTRRLTLNVGEPVPEPSTIALLGIGLAGLGGAAVRRKYRKDKKQ